MTFRTLRRALLVSAVLGAGGCGSSEPTYYTLTAWPGAAQSGGPLTVKVRTPSVASYLDRDYIVQNDHDYHLTIDHSAAWGEPLADMIGQTFTQDLAQRLPGSNVFGQSGAISTEAQAVAELNIMRFAETPDGQAEIVAALSVQRPGSGPAASQTLHLTAPLEGTGVGAMAAALSRLLGEVADAAARQARTLGPLPVAPAMASAGTATGGA